MSTDEKNQNWIELVVRWAFGQPFNNVLLLLCLAGGGYVVVKLVPVHIAEIQKGYERIETSHREERTRDEEQHTKQTTVLMQTLEKMIDRSGDHRPAARGGSAVAGPVEE